MQVSLPPAHKGHESDDAAHKTATTASGFRFPSIRKLGSQPGAFPEYTAASYPNKALLPNEAGTKILNAND